jgi:hypothetical protein
MAPQRRTHRARAIVTTLASLLFGFGTGPVHGIIFYDTGDPTYNTLPPGGSLTNSGWLWGVADGVQRWGANLVAGVVTDDTVGELLQATFDAQGGADECHLSSGDSTGCKPNNCQSYCARCPYKTLSQVRQSFVMPSRVAQPGARYGQKIEDSCR